MCFICLFWLEGPPHKKTYTIHVIWDVAEIALYMQNFGTLLSNEAEIDGQIIHYSNVLAFFQSIRISILYEFYKNVFTIWKALCLCFKCWGFYPALYGIPSHEVNIAGTIKEIHINVVKCCYPASIRTFNVFWIFCEYFNISIVWLLHHVFQENLLD